MAEIQLQLQNEFSKHTKQGKRNDLENTGYGLTSETPVPQVEKTTRKIGEIFEESYKTVERRLETFSEINKYPDKFAHVKESLDRGTMKINTANKIVTRRQRSLPKMSLHVGQWDVFVCDIPIKFTDEGVRGAAENHYDTMTIQELAELIIPAAENAVIYFWIPPSIIYEKFADNRESIPEDFQFILFTEILKHTLNEVGGNYIKSVRNFGAARVREKDAKTEDLRKLVDDTVTSKQVTKTIEGRVAEIQDLYEPKTRDEALFCGHYHGTQCPQCQSWRTTLYLEGPELRCKCYACDAKFPRGMISKCRHCLRPFYEAVLKMMVEKSTEIINNELIKTNCPYDNCGVEIVLPINLLVPFVTKVAIT